MKYKDYYRILGVSETASAKEIKSAYRKLALKYHPDRNPGDKAAEEQFKEAAEAYAILADTEKRQLYDRFGHAGVTGASAGAGGFDPTIFADFSDIFSGLGDVKKLLRAPSSGALRRLGLRADRGRSAGPSASARTPSPCRASRAP